MLFFKYLKIGLFLFLTIFSLAACGSIQSDSAVESTAAAVEEVVVVPQPTNPSELPQQPLRMITLLNFTYPSTYTRSGKAALVDGRYSEEAAPGSASELTVQMGYHAFGELNGDDLEDAAVILISDPGGSGTFFDLVTVSSGNGDFTASEPVYLGDRIQVENIEIKDGQIELIYLTQGSEDSMASPSERVLRVYTLQGGLLHLEKTEALGSGFEIPVDTGMVLTLDELPANSFEVPVTLILSGTVSQMPFEKTLNYRIYDETDKLIMVSYIMVDGEYGESGTFKVEIPFGEEAAGSYTIEVVDISAATGEVIASDQVKVETK